MSASEAPAPAVLVASDHTDGELVARIRAGSERAFDALVRTYAQALVAFAYRYVKDGDAAVDLVQDAFASLWERRATWTVRGSVRAYLYTMIRNRALNLVRHETVVERWRATVRVAPQVPSASERAERAELSVAVGRAFDALSPKARDVARLWFLEEMTQPEIAQALGMSLAAVGNHVGRAAKRLRILLSDVWP